MHLKLLQKTNTDLFAGTDFNESLCFVCLSTDFILHKQ